MTKNQGETVMQITRRDLMWCYIDGIEQLAEDQFEKLEIEVADLFEATFLTIVRAALEIIK